MQPDARGQGKNGHLRSQNAGGHFLPEWRVGNLPIENMMDGHRLRRNRATGIDEKRAPFGVDHPSPRSVQHNVLPADLANIIWAVSGGFEVNNPDEPIGHDRLQEPGFYRALTDRHCLLVLFSVN
jgi:hypothetical protein